MGRSFDVIPDHLVAWMEQQPIYFVASAPGVPLAEVRLTPGMQTPKGGRLVPNGEPGFGLGLTLEGVRAMAV